MVTGGFFSASECGHQHINSLQNSAEQRENHKVRKESKV